MNKVNPSTIVRKLKSKIYDYRIRAIDDHFWLVKYIFLQTQLQQVTGVQRVILKYQCLLFVMVIQIARMDQTKKTALTLVQKEKKFQQIKNAMESKIVQMHLMKKDVQ